MKGMIRPDDHPPTEFFLLIRIHNLFKYIEDNDLWRRSLPNSKHFSLGLDSKKIEFDITKNPNLFQQLQDLNLEKLIEEGKIEEKRVQDIIDGYLPKAFPVKLGGANANFGTCLAVETSHATIKSELGNQLAQRSREKGLRSMAVILFCEEKLPDRYIVSLRSLDKEDTTEISKIYGGGGHLNASGFNIDKKSFDSWRL